MNLRWIGDNERHSSKNLSNCKYLAEGTTCLISLFAPAGQGGFGNLVYSVILWSVVQEYINMDEVYTHN